MQLTALEALLPGHTPERPLKRKDALEHADVSEKHALALMGLADGSAVHGLYGSRLMIKLLDSAI